MKLGFGELLIIFVVILFIVGPDKIPGFAKKLGKGLRAFRDATSDMTKEIRENVVEPLNEASAPLREAMEPIEEIKNDINGTVAGLNNDVIKLNSTLKKTVSPGEDPREGEAPVPKKPMKTAIIYEGDLPKEEPAPAPEAPKAPAAEPTETGSAQQPEA